VVGPRASRVPSATGVKADRVAAEEGNVTTADPRCPDCGSLVRTGMSWCTLCHADLRSQEEKDAARLESSLLLVAGGAQDTQDGAEVQELVSAHLGATSAAAGPTATAAAPTGPPRGRHARASAPLATGVPLTSGEAGPAQAPTADLSFDAIAAATAAESEAKLAELREAGIDVDGMLAMLAADRGHDPLAGFVSERLGSKGSRAIVILVASAALTSIGVLVMFALGSIIH